MNVDFPLSLILYIVKFPVHLLIMFYFAIFQGMDPVGGIFQKDLVMGNDDVGEIGSIQYIFYPLGSIAIQHGG